MTIFCQHLQKRVGKWQNLEVLFLHRVAISRESLRLEQTGNAKTELVDFDRIEDFHRIDVNLFSKLPNSRQRLKRV
jgi:hypothetical protein